MFELSKRKSSRQVIENFKRENENYTQMIDQLSEQQNIYKVDIANLEQMISI